MPRSGSAAWLSLFRRRPPARGRAGRAPGVLSACLPPSAGLRGAGLSAPQQADLPDDHQLSDRGRRRLPALSVLPHHGFRADDIVDRSMPGAVRWQAIPVTTSIRHRPRPPGGARRHDDPALAARAGSRACAVSRWHAVDVSSARGRLASGSCERIAPNRAAEVHRIHLKFYASLSATISEAWLLGMSCPEAKLDQRGPQRRVLWARPARHRSRKLLRARAVAPNRCSAEASGR
jgi:hypothetical protein